MVQGLGSIVQGDETPYWVLGFRDVQGLFLRAVLTGYTGSICGPRLKAKGNFLAILIRCGCVHSRERPWTVSP